MAGLCVYGCQHPLWGGQGLCSGQADPIDYECLCDEGYLAIDSDGNPGCVPRSALIGIYSMIAVAGALTSGFLLWHAREQRKLPERIQLGRRAVLRFRIIATSSFASLSTAIVFSIAAIRVAGNAALLESGMLRGLYVITMPAIATVAPLIVELWLESLPSQLLPSNGIVVKLKRLAEKRYLFVQMGISGFVGSLVVGVMPLLISLDIVKAARIADFMISVTAAAGGSSVIGTASYLTVIINRAKNKAPQSSRDFYVRAIKTVWTQVSVLSVSAMSQIIAAAVLGLTSAGEGTPVILYAALVINANVTCTASVHFGKLSRGASSPPCSDRSAPIPKSTPQCRSGILGVKSTAADGAGRENGANTGARAAGRTLPLAAPRGERRVVPTAEC